MDVTPLGSPSTSTFVSQGENQIPPDPMNVAACLRPDFSQPQVIGSRCVTDLAPDIDLQLVQDMFGKLLEGVPFYICHSPKYCGESPNDEGIPAEDYSYPSLENEAQVSLAFQRGWLKEIFMTLYNGCTEILEMPLSVLIVSYPSLIAEGGVLSQIIKALQSLCISGCEAHKLEADQLLTFDLIGGTLIEWGSEQSPLIGVSADFEETEILSESLIMILLECLRFSLTLLHELVLLDATNQDILGTGIATDFRRTYYSQASISDNQTE